jgi:nicotinate-nucleotide adenylyltransferase
MEKIIALYGGSFNPPTNAHREIGALLLRQLPVDEVWYLVAPQNRLKPKTGMASFEDRVAMTRLNVTENPRLVVQDIEKKYAETKPKGMMETAETLKLLTRDFPGHRFIWTMGADNLASFHQWSNYQYILDNFPVAIIPRANCTQAALKVSAALNAEWLSCTDDMLGRNGLYMLDYSENDINATLCRTELSHGQTPKSMRPNVARYAIRNGVYVPR